MRHMVGIGRELSRAAAARMSRHLIAAKENSNRFPGGLDFNLMFNQMVGNRIITVVELHMVIDIDAHPFKLSVLIARFGERF